MNCMYLFVAFGVLSAAVAQAQICDHSKCKLPSCQCPEMSAPISGNIPQLVALSFDDSIVELNYRNYYKPLLFNRHNPDNCPISATFFVPHEYTDYSIVNTLYNNGFQIGSHSITKNFSMEYWGNADRNLIQSEMGGQRQIISKFANIPIEHINGSRIPQFQLNGDETYFGLKKAGFLYDSSWPTYTVQRFFPYTLDFASEQQCVVGKCPTSSIPGFWIVPIINWVGLNNTQCNNLLGCRIQGTATQIFNWMKTNFEKSYNGNRSPFTVLINSAWFQYTENSFEALNMFFDHLATLKDVFVVSEDKVMEWAKNPVGLDKYSSCRTNQQNRSCQRKTCKLENNYGEERYMTSCVGSCPARYPWLGNTNGN